MKLHRYVDHQRLHIVTKDVISLSISVLLLFRHYISHKIIFGAPSSGGVLCSACGAFILVSYSPVVELLGFLRTYYKTINFAASFNSLSGCDDFLLSADTIICKNFGPNFFPTKVWA